MQDYSKYPYKRLLEYIDTMCQKRGEERDFVNYLLAMNHAESIEKLMEMYDNLYKLLAVLFFGTNKLPRHWYHPETWGYDNTYLIEELNYCLNESVLKWHKRQEKPTNEQCLYCLVNLRESDNVIEVGEELYKSLSPEKHKEDKDILIIVRRHYLVRKELEIESRYGRKELKRNNYISFSQYLAAHGRIFDVAERSFAKKNGISYEGLAEQYWKELESKNEFERILKEQEIKVKKLQEKRRFYEMLKLLVILLPIMVVFFFVMVKMGIFGTIIIIGIIGAIPKLLLTGKF